MIVAIVVPTPLYFGAAITGAPKTAAPPPSAAKATAATALPSP